MMRCDAEWLQKALARFEPETLSPVINLGSSTRHFRTVVQPYVQEKVFGPLEARGVRVVHSDLKAGDGIDVSGDIFNDAEYEKLKAVGARAVICTHMFEHIVDRDELVRRILGMLPPGGLFFVTVPYSYHEHHDPIDTLYRPSPDELAQLFAGQKILDRAELEGEYYWVQFKKRPVTMFFRHFFRFFIPFVSWTAWKRSMRKLYWLFNPYKVSAIIGSKA